MRPVAKLGAGVALIVAALSFLAFEGLRHNLVYYITPSELLAKGHSDVGIQLQLGGQVRPNSIVWDKSTHVLRFVLQDTKARVPVVSDVLAPPLFHGGGGAVVQGVFAHGTFNATQILVKHDSTYEPPKPGQKANDDRYAER